MSKEQNEDNSLLEQYLNDGDLSHLGDLYLRHSEMVYYVCLRYLKSTEGSKDAVMQIFEQLIDKVKKQPINDFPRWLYVLTKNHCLMQLRKNKSHLEIVTNDFMEFNSFEHPEGQKQLEEEKLQQMERCLETLNEKQRRSVKLFYLEEKCYKEVSALTGYQLNEVKSYIQNGKRKLRICMEEASHE